MLIKQGFFRQIAEKSSKLKFHENPSSGSRVVPFGLTDRQIRRSQKSRFAVLPMRLQTVRICCSAGNKMLASLHTHRVCQGSLDKTPVLTTQCGECVVDLSLDMYFE
jgi:hypothetical protein